MLNLKLIHTEIYKTWRICIYEDLEYNFWNFHYTIQRVYKRKRKVKFVNFCERSSGGAIINARLDIEEYKSKRIKKNRSRHCGYEF